MPEVEAVADQADPDGKFRTQQASDSGLRRGEDDDQRRTQGRDQGIEAGDRRVRIEADHGVADHDEARHAHGIVDRPVRQQGAHGVLPVQEIEGDGGADGDLPGARRQHEEIQHRPVAGSPLRQPQAAGGDGQEGGQDPAPAQTPDEHQE